MQNRDKCYMQVLGSKRRVEFWEEHQPCCALRQPLSGFVLCIEEKIVDKSKKIEAIVIFFEVMIF
jgi:hypothetical protein